MFLFTALWRIHGSAAHVLRSVNCGCSPELINVIHSTFLCIWCQFPFRPAQKVRSLHLPDLLAPWKTVLSHLSELSLQLVLRIGRLTDPSVKCQVGVRPLPPHVLGCGFQRVVRFLKEGAWVGTGVLRVADVVVTEFCPCFRDCDSVETRSERCWKTRFCPLLQESLFKTQNTWKLRQDIQYLFYFISYLFFLREGYPMCLSLPIWFQFNFQLDWKFHFQFDLTYGCWYWCLICTPNAESPA